MMRVMMKSKIHRAAVTDANVHYEGSLTVDSALLKLADMVAYERVQVVNLENGRRFETYLIPGKPGGGEICLNGGAAYMGKVGDKVIIITYALMEDARARRYKPKVILVDAKNRPIKRKK